MLDGDDDVRKALARFCPPGWKGALPPAVDRRDLDVVILREAGLVNIGHVPPIVWGGSGQDVLLLTIAGYAAAEALDACRAALSDAGTGAPDADR